ncbi:hypothetical protein C8R43DRAFT_961855 [Mycena crocata]|nr:hypothetical protein C8R43DRAFT_961855 [Mycena crocata]
MLWWALLNITLFLFPYVAGILAFLSIHPSLPPTGLAIYLCLYLLLVVDGLHPFVTASTTIGDIYRHLISPACVPTGGTVQLYFTHAGQRVNWDDMIKSFGLGPLSHLHMRARTLGGATGDSEPGSSHRHKDTARMDKILDAEGLDEWGEPDKSKPHQPHRKSKRKAPPVNTDSEDNNFDGDDGSSPNDSDVEMVMSNEEVAASLSSHSLKGKECATEPIKKGRKKGSAPAV